MNGLIIFESVLMLFTKLFFKISLCLSKLQLAKVDTFLLRHTVLNVI